MKIKIVKTTKKQKRNVIILSIMVVMLCASLFFVSAGHDNHKPPALYNYSHALVHAGDILIKNDLNVTGNILVSGVLTGTLNLGYTYTNISSNNITYETFYMGVEGENIGFNDIHNIEGGNVGDIINVFPLVNLKNIRLIDGIGNLDLEADCNLAIGDKAELRKENGDWKLIICNN